MTERQFASQAGQPARSQRLDADQRLAHAVPIYQTTSYQFKDTRPCRPSVCVGRIWQYLYPHHEPHHRRVRATPGRPGRRCRALWQPAPGMRPRLRRSSPSAARAIISSQPSTCMAALINQFNYTFPRLGIEVTFVDPSDPENFRRAIRPNTKILYGETLGNPGINVFPFEEVAAIGQRIPDPAGDRQHLCHSLSVPPV